MLNSCEEQLPVHLAVVAASKYYAVVKHSRHSNCNRDNK